MNSVVSATSKHLVHLFGQIRMWYCILLWWIFYSVWFFNSRFMLLGYVPSFVLQAFIHQHVSLKMVFVHEHGCWWCFWWDLCATCAIHRENCWELSDSASFIKGLYTCTINDLLNHAPKASKLDRRDSMLRLNCNILPVWNK